MKPAGKNVDQGKKANEEVEVVQVNRPVAWVIKVIHCVVDRLAVVNNHLRAKLIKVRFWSQAHPFEVMFVLAPKRNRDSKLIYDLTFTEQDLEGVDVPDNDALVLMANIRNYNVKRALIDPGSSSEVMCLNIYNKLQTLHT